MTWAGVDVGGRRKGFHVATIGSGGVVEVAGLTRVAAVVKWLGERRPRLVAVDCPLTPAPDGEASRAGELALVKAKICSIRFTPDLARLRANPHYYEWIDHGLELYARLAEVGLAAIECFPTASWTRWAGPRGRVTRAAWTQAAIGQLVLAGVPVRLNQDTRDAIAAALTARAHELGQTERFGDIVVPASNDRDGPACEPFSTSPSLEPGAHTTAAPKIGRGLGDGMRIAILGWGSLIWDPRTLNGDGTWRPDGPVLPVEFSRKSSKGHLTLVIDADHGAPVRTYWIESGLRVLADALENLREREGPRVRAEDIGFLLCRAVPPSKDPAPGRCRTETVRAEIQAWLDRSDLDAVIWTDLPPTFPAFSVDAALEYLRKLSGEARQVAERYFRQAPDQTVTPLRERARLILGWG